MSRPFQITVARAQDACTVYLSGEIDFAAALELDPKLQQAARHCGGQLFFDLNEVTLIDSEGLKALLNAAERVRRRAGQTRVIGASKAVRRVLDIVGLDDVLGVVREGSEPI